MNLLYFVVVMAVLLMVACTTMPSRVAQDDLQGKWTCISAVVDGRALPEETVRLLVLTLTKERYRTEKGSETLFDSTYSIDASKTPKEINMVGTEGALLGKEAQGIYSLEGGTLRICYTMPGEQRPPSFESTAGSKRYSIVWRRKNATAANR